MKTHSRLNLALSALFVGSAFYALAADEPAKEYQGKPFEDSKYHDGAQKIPGKVQCAYYDLGGEGVAYHDEDAKNNGSGGLNPIDPNKPNYLHEFRAKEGVDISYTKFSDIDNTQYNVVQPPKEQLYVGWTSAGEWFNMTVDVQEAGTYTVDLLYTCNHGGTVMLDLNGKPVSPTPLNITSTNDPKDPVGWRQWHHWNLAKDLVSVDLPKGKNLLTFHIVTEGNMNLAYLDFHTKDAKEAEKTEKPAAEPVKTPEKAEPATK